MKSARSPVAFGPYIITRRIARGGMAEIYRARARQTATSPSRWVALKLMRSSLGHEELRARLFERESRIAEKLHHPNVVPLYQHGTEMGRPYLAMEYQRGRDLSHLLKDEKSGRELIPLDLGLYIGFHAAAGLGHAHALIDPETQKSFGIVHRDASPGNVMVSYEGVVKVLDFGVARINETQGVHTQTGTLRGKFAYMSPEQTIGEEIDARSDVFSLGTVLYELLTGVNCFRAANPIATLERVQSLRPVPPSRANRQIPKEIDRILARCLAKDKKRRYRDAGALSEVLGEYLDKIGMITAGEAALAKHMSEVFEWEKHEEESELAREEDEVALFDVVDFAAALRDDTGLDSAHMAISQEEEASQSEVKSVALARRDGRELGEEEVFEGEQSNSARFSVAPGSPQVAMDDGPTTTVPQPVGGPTARIIIGQPVEGFGNTMPVAPALNPMLSKAGLLTPSLGVEFAAARATVMATESVKRARPWLLAGGLLGLVLAIAGIVTRGAMQDVDPPAARPQVMEPVTITLPDPATQQAARLEAAKVDAAKVEAAKVEAAKVEAAKVEAAKVEAAKVEAAKVEAAKVEAAKVEAPSPETAKVVPALRLEPVSVRPAPHGTPETDGGPAVERPRPRPLPPPAKALPPPATVAKKKTAVPAVPTGFLNVGAKPWAEIKIDGRAWPYQTPQAGIELPAGKHTVTLSNKETGVTKSTVVYIKAGAYRTVMMDLKK